MKKVTKTEDTAKPTKTKPTRIKKTKETDPDKVIVNPPSNITGEFVALGPQFHEGVAYMSRSDMLTLENAHLQVEKLIQAIAIKQHEIHQFRQQLQETIRQKEVDIMTLKSLCKAKEDEYRIIQKKIEEVYDIDMTKTVYDDRTGRLTKIE